ncbi:MAG: hypothetical protein B6U88_00065 [Candidatus Aenigmarchaeota archaeon ex4484_56]|nr:MAG: hypothetical protein B6U88_00065 [Candidatus Aenigmarchaeota archaeon ex4484_56]
MHRKICILFLVILLVSPSFALKNTTIYLTAVQETDEGYRGALATLNVNIMNGSGYVYIDTWPLTKIDTQASVRIAKQVACNLIERDCSNHDFYYVIRSESQIVGGPSGGAAITIATLASLLDLNISNKVFITGTINPDGTIGPVSGLLEKLSVVAKENGTLFLIPEGQSKLEIEKSNGNIIVTSSTSEEIDLVNYAKTHYNITVIEVKTIQEAFRYFTNYKFIEKDASFRKTKQYQKVMERMNNELYQHAKKLQEECKKNLNSYEVPYPYYTQIEELCNTPMDKSYTNMNIGNYYSSASIAFSNSIKYRYGLNLISLLNSKNKKIFVKNYITHLEKQIKEPNTTNIELYAIVEERLSEAENNIEFAWKNYYNTDYMKSVYYSSLSEERLYTANLWEDYSEDFPDYLIVPKDLKETARELLSEAYSILTYASLSTSSQSYLEKSKELLKQAEENYDGGRYYASVIFSLKSIALGEISANIGYNDLDYLIKLHKKKARLVLNKTNSIIGQSYYEYAETLENEDKNSALIYYVYAEKLSNLQKIFDKTKKIQSMKMNEYVEPVKCKCFLNELIGFVISIFRTLL